MNIFNLGLPELILIFILAVIVFGPRNMVKTARDMGRWIRNVTRSPFWRDVWATRRQLDELPKVLAREAQIDETLQELNREATRASLSVTESLRDAVRELQSEHAAPPG